MTMTTYVAYKDKAKLQPSNLLYIDSNMLNWSNSSYFGMTTCPCDLVHMTKSAHRTF